MNGDDDLTAFRRQQNRAALWTDTQISHLEARLVALEEIAAARWPASIGVRRRLRRQLRASVARIVHGTTFAERRTEATTLDVLGDMPGGGR